VIGWFVAFLGVLAVVLGGSSGQEFSSHPTAAVSDTQSGQARSGVGMTAGSVAASASLNSALG
jgi:hypothetical protein